MTYSYLTKLIATCKACCFLGFTGLLLLLPFGLTGCHRLAFLGPNQHVQVARLQAPISKTYTQYSLSFYTCSQPAQWHSVQRSAQPEASLTELVQALLQGPTEHEATQQHLCSALEGVTFKRLHQTGQFTRLVFDNALAETASAHLLQQRLQQLRKTLEPLGLASPVHIALENGQILDRF